MIEYICNKQILNCSLYLRKGKAPKQQPNIEMVIMRINLINRDVRVETNRTTPGLKANAELMKNIPDSKTGNKVFTFPTANILQMLQQTFFSGTNIFSVKLNCVLLFRFKFCSALIISMKQFQTKKALTQDSIHLSIWIVSDQILTSIGNILT